VSFETISVIGLGYIGLPTAAAFAARKKKVIGVDVNQQTVDIINKGEIHIVEPELDMVVHAAVTEGYLRATTSPEPADAFLVAVPTPFKENHEPDLSYIQAAVDAIAPVLKQGDLVILESTSPVGATEMMAEWLASARPDLTFPQDAGENSDISVAHCPERVLPGHVMRELVENDRIVGGMTSSCARRSVELYRTFVEGECIVTDARTAEMCKLTENAFRDVNIAFANELSVICDKLDINVWELIGLANRHPRVSILQPGPGVGGHCIAVDPWFIVSRTPELAKLIKTAREVNDDKPHRVIDQVKISIQEYLQNNLDKNIKDVCVACYGLAFKADIDDLRESPALLIAQKIAQEHAGDVVFVEPNDEQLSAGVLGAARQCALSEAMEKADIHVLLVDHKEFNDNVDKFSELEYLTDTRGLVK